MGGGRAIAAIVAASKRLAPCMVVRRGLPCHPFVRSRSRSRGCNCPQVLREEPHHHHLCRHVLVCGNCVYYLRLLGLVISWYQAGELLTRWCYRVEILTDPRRSERNPNRNPQLSVVPEDFSIIMDLSKQGQSPKETKRSQSQDLQTKDGIYRFSLITKRLYCPTP